MVDALGLSKLINTAKVYAREVVNLVGAGSTTEATYYPAVRSLIAVGLLAGDLPFDVRINTRE